MALYPLLLGGSPSVHSEGSTLSADADVLVIGGGPAGAAAAILMAKAGWRVILIEQHRYPRDKVCGECVAAGTLVLLDELGVGPAFQALAGPELTQVGWMSAAQTVVAEMPVCSEGPYRYGRALGRDRLDMLLLEGARSAGVTVLQPAKVHTVAGVAGCFQCEYEWLDQRAIGALWRRDMQTLRVSVVVDAHGSWERGPQFSGNGCETVRRKPALRSDLLAFKASFRNTRLPIGLLPVLAFNGGYGGMVVSDNGRTTIACCIRRDALRRCRALAPGESVGGAIEANLRRSCRGIPEALEASQRDGPWLAVGPVRPGIGADRPDGALRVGNAAGETHPLIGEGIRMALESAALLVHCLTRHPVSAFDANRSLEVRRAYVTAWRREFAPRLRIAGAYAQIAMSPALAVPTGRMLKRLPRLLTLAARLVGKSRCAVVPRTLRQEMT